MQKSNARRRATKGRAALSGLFGVAALIMPLLLIIAGARLLFSHDEPASDALPTPAPAPSIVLELTDIDPGVPGEVVLELISIGKKEEDNALDLSGSAPKVLIYHTHTTEAYFPTEEYPYEAGKAFRTDDNTMNVVAIGERLKYLLEHEYGISVIHDITNHEPPKLATSYSRSVVTMLAYKEKYPSLALYIDLHRDAYGEPEKPADYLTIDGRETARLMFVVGTGKGATGTGFDKMPDFASNYALALRLTDYLTDIDPMLARNIRVKSGRYNQHVSNACLLAEVGHNANTFEQAMAAVEYLAEAIAAVAGIDSADAASTVPSEDGILRLSP